MRFEELEDVLVAEEFGDFVANAFVFGTLSAEDAALARKARKPILALPSAVSAGSRSWSTESTRSSSVALICLASSGWSRSNCWREPAYVRWFSSPVVEPGLVVLNARSALSQSEGFLVGRVSE